MLCAKKQYIFLSEYVLITNSEIGKVPNRWDSCRIKFRYNYVALRIGHFKSNDLSVDVV